MQQESYVCNSCHHQLSDFKYLVSNSNESLRFDLPYYCERCYNAMHLVKFLVHLNRNGLKTVTLKIQKVEGKKDIENIINIIMDDDIIRNILLRVFKSNHLDKKEVIETFLSDFEEMKKLRMKWRKHFR